MAVPAENLCFENMGFGSFPIYDWVMGSVLGTEVGFCVQEFQPLEQQRKELCPFLDYSEILQPSSYSSSFELVQSLFSYVEKQRLEMDLFLQLENQRFRRSILEEESRQQAILISKHESRLRNLLLQKDNELTAARMKTIELQYFLKGAEMEAKAWEKKGKENEAIALDLYNRLNRVGKKYCSFPNAAQENQEDDEDAVSFSDSSSSYNTTKTKGQEKIIEKMSCKLCQARKSCVVFFPCRHLCSCKPCEGLLGHCPVCGTVKEENLEVFLV